jgi:hypothetical protein
LTGLAAGAIIALAGEGRERKGVGTAGAAREVTGSSMRADRFRIFVSYSRADSALADEIAAGLEYDGGFDVLIDREDIHEGEDWQKRLGALIAQADTVVFILSRRSAVSPICQWEVDQARALSKRIVPVQAEALAGVAPPPALAALNYVRFDEHRSFMAGLSGLRRALRTDVEWLREHTRLLTRAQEWQAAGQADNRLRAGDDIAAAKAWLDRVPADGLQPTELHRDFIQASDRAEALRLSAERERAERLQRAVRRTRVAFAAALIGACVAGGIGIYATLQRREAERARQAADDARQEAEMNRQSAQKEAARARQAAEEAERQEQLARASAERASRESERADKFVNLVSSHPAGRRAMEKICLEAIAVTGALATTTDREQWRRHAQRFWELYYAPMYIVELHERKTSGRDASAIETRMVRYGEALRSIDGARVPLPQRALCGLARAVRDGCVAHLQVTAPEPCG